MALSDEIKEEQKKVRDMTFSGKIKYNWDYYKIHIIVGKPARLPECGVYEYGPVV